MQFERKILKALRERIDTPEIVVVTGMRRVGKTTALRMIHDEIPELQAGVEVKQRGDNHDLRRVAALGQSLKLREQYVATREFSDLPGLIPAQDL